MIDDIGKIVRFHRRQSKLSQAALARLSGIGKTALFDIEQGKPTVRLQTLARVLHALNIKLNWDSPLRTKYESARKSDSEGA